MSPSVQSLEGRGGEGHLPGTNGLAIFLVAHQSSPPTFLPTCPYIKAISMLGHLSFSSSKHTMAFKFAVLFALVAVASAGGFGGHLGGHSVGSRKQDDFGNYAFNYQIVDGLGATNGRWEAGNGKFGKVVGSYNLADIDGRARRVDYVADGLGFRAKVKTNEPGTSASLPAAVVMASPYTGTVVAGPVAGPAFAVKAAPVVAAVGHGGYGFGGYGGYGGYGGFGHGIGVGHGLGHGVGFGKF